MRKAVIFLSVLLLATAGYAADSSRGSVSSVPDDLFRVSPPAQSAPSFQLPAASLLSPGSEEPKALITFGDKKHAPVTKAGPGACYTMRTYKFRRVAPDSDVTVPSGYSTCLSASRLKLKSAISR